MKSRTPLQWWWSLVAAVSLLLVAVTGAAEVPQDYDISQRPEPEKGPTVVDIRVFLIDLVEINDVKQSFTASLYFVVRYRDPRLADPTAASIRTFALNDIWWPDLGIVNRRNVQLMFPHHLQVDREGNVRYEQRAFGEFSTHLDVREFPFDTQELRLEVASYTLGPESLELRLDSEGSGRSQEFSLTGWSVGDGGVDVQPKRDGGINRAQLIFHVTVQRRTPFFRWSTLVPLSLIVLMAWCALWIDPQYLPSRIGLSTASIFSLIAFRFSLRVMLPQVDYMTYLDEFVFACTLLVFGVLGQSIAIGRLMKGGREALARRVDVWSRAAYLLVFIVVAMATLRLQV